MIVRISEHDCKRGHIPGQRVGYPSPVPPRHHRTVDRITALVEMVAASRHGLSLAVLADRLEAPKSSVHELVNGLVATGYLTEEDHRYRLGPAPFVLTLMGNPLAAQEVDRDLLPALHRRLGCSVLVGIQVGGSMVYIDQIGEDAALEFAARHHNRRSLYATASGKIILANLPTPDMDAFLLSATLSERGEVDRFLRDLSEIRRTGLAYNMADTVPDVYSVATALHRASGEFVGAVCAIGPIELKPELPEIGRRMQHFLAERAGSPRAPGVA
jgi:DNA-binding IclR family transcriptional regulator